MRDAIIHDFAIVHYYTPEGHEHRWVLWDRGECIYVTGHIGFALNIVRKHLGDESDAYRDFLWEASGLASRVLGGRQHIFYANLLRDPRYVSG